MRLPSFGAEAVPKFWVPNRISFCPGSGCSHLFGIDPTEKGLRFPDPFCPFLAPERHLQLLIGECDLILTPKIIRPQERDLERSFG